MASNSDIKRHWITWCIVGKNLSATGRKLLKADLGPPLHRQSQRVRLDQEESNTHNLQNDRQFRTPKTCFQVHSMIGNPSRHDSKETHVSFYQLFWGAATIPSPLSVLYIVLAPKPWIQGTCIFLNALRNIFLWSDWGNSIAQRKGTTSGTVRCNINCI